MQLGHGVVAEAKAKAKLIKFVRPLTEVCREAAKILSN